MSAKIIYGFTRCTNMYKGIRSIRGPAFETNSSATHSICLDSKDAVLRDQTLLMVDDFILIDNQRWYDFRRQLIDNSSEVKAVYALGLWGERARKCIEAFCGGTIYEIPEADYDSEGKISCPESDEDILNFVFSSKSWLLCYQQCDDPVLLECSSSDNRKFSRIIFGVDTVEYYVLEFAKSIGAVFPKIEGSIFDTNKFGYNDPFTKQSFQYRGSDQKEFIIKEERTLMFLNDCDDSVNVQVVLQNCFSDEDLARAKSHYEFD